MLVRTEVTVKKKTKTAGDFTLDEAVDMFKLQHGTSYSSQKSHRVIAILEIPDVQKFQVSDCFRKASPSSSHI
jgi:hypothetical protein